MKRFLNMVADIFYPRCCPVCQKILADQRRMICPECEKELRPIGHPRCYKCGKPIETGEYCRDCQKHRHMYEQGRGIFVYDGIMRRSVTRYKYYGCREYGDFCQSNVSICTERIAGMEAGSDRAGSGTQVEGAAERF